MMMTRLTKIEKLSAVMTPKLVALRFHSSTEAAAAPTELAADGAPATVAQLPAEMAAALEQGGLPQPLVIGAYRMGYDIAPGGVGSRLTVFIEYDLPAWPWRLLGLFAGRIYGRWCVRAMANDAARMITA